MDLYNTFAQTADSLMAVYILDNAFDNNFDLAHEYDKWSEEAFNTNIPWTSFTNEDITIENMNYMIATACDYSYDSGIQMPYDVEGLLWMYGLAMEQEMRSTLQDKFNLLMRSKQDSLC